MPPPASVEAGSSVRLTSLRKGVRAPTGGRIEVCPKCGRKGAGAHYKDGSHLYKHSATFRGWYWEVTDSCFIPTDPSPES
jgi:hypothetical protein